MEVIKFYTVFINMSAFISRWFINDLVEASGYIGTFSVQAIMRTFGILPIYFLLQRYGPRLQKTDESGIRRPY
ncbi:hypothetical protein F5882DRAFT_122366 [Hyaloscypha sp. PMI_1271]|nr:hypothetical protein F5882DRAFT_122366 [Hyaloscypha sp. PMI_1271]